jgi:hypothetical protein
VPIREYRGEPVSLSEPDRLEPAGQPAGALAQRAVRQAQVPVDKRLTLRVALRGVGQAQGEIHAVPAACAIASTIGS